VYGNQSNVFVIDPPIQYNDDGLTSNQNLGRRNFMNFTTFTMKSEPIN
jgi:hypothetical protein